MNLFPKSIVLASLFSVSIFSNPFEIEDQTKDCIFAAALAGLDYEQHELPEATRALCAHIAHQSKKDVRNVKKNDVRIVVNSMTTQDRKTVYEAFTKEDKQIAIEGLFVMFLDEGNNDNLRHFVDRLLFLVFVGTPISEELQHILLNNKNEINYIRQIKRGVMNYITIKNELVKRWNKILGQVPDGLQEEVQRAVERRKQRFLRSQSVETLQKRILEAFKRKLDRQ